ncbi:hypothetical protein LTR64_001417 [Lithohypha guttulata]|uniref:Prefoldin subunit 3 n=1 Tax=Lithohypha guttulata TaxID=1690604 RepID=A0AAN7SUQ8_9EURO|nr:hypothetical protein LTR51_003611 [Lithohypha guttulata]KAK5082116.1 hypothetical protein LTR05_007259 [Lithohypha guttulata]
MATKPEEPKSNPRGIPTFPFLPNVTDYVKSQQEVEGTLQRFQEMISKYQFMSQNVERRAAGLREKLPEMRKSLETVKFLRMQKGMSANDTDGDELEDDLDDKSGIIETTFPLQDTLYAHATVDTKNLEEVYLWLGANVMVAYPLDEAEKLLQEKLDKAKESLKAAEEDLEFVRVQTTTLEVATARVHNWDVGEKRKLREQGKLEDKEND